MNRHRGVMIADLGMERLELSGDGVSLVADAAGPRTGPPVLFLHGGGQTRQSWGGAINQAAARGYRAIALDLRGHGESGWSPDGDYDMAHFVEDVRAVIRTLERPPALVGASLGGLVSLVIAAWPPPVVSGLVLVDVAARIEAEGAGEIAAFMSSAPDGFASLEEAADCVAAYLPHRPRPRDASGLMRNLRLRGDGRYHWHWDPAFIRLSKVSSRPDPQLFEDAARALTLPTLLVRGGRSRVVSREGVEAFLKLAPATEWVDVAGADHMVAGDANDLFNASVFEFLGRHVPVEPAR